MWSKVDARGQAAWRGYGTYRQAAHQLVCIEGAVEIGIVVDKELQVTHLYVCMYACMYVCIVVDKELQVTHEDGKLDEIERPVAVGIVAAEDGARVEAADTQAESSHCLR